MHLLLICDSIDNSATHQHHNFGRGILPNNIERHSPQRWETGWVCSSYSNQLVSVDDLAKTKHIRALKVASIVSIL